MSIPRLEWADFRKLAPETSEALLSISAAAKKHGLEESILELVKLRASRINGCAFCVQMHSTELRKMGESEERIQLLCVWQESPVYSERERAALAWTESLTLISEHRVSDDVFSLVSAKFGTEELVWLTSMVIAINSWNRIAKAYQFRPLILK